MLYLFYPCQSFTFSTAKEVENVIRKNGAIPATVAILNGRIHVGLTEQQLEELAESTAPAIKTSRRDLPHVISQVCT
jgi:pseudouridine-5'-phosphate glycosidase